MTTPPARSEGVHTHTHTHTHLHTHMCVVEVCTQQRQVSTRPEECVHRRIVCAYIYIYIYIHINMHNIYTYIFKY